MEPTKKDIIYRGNPIISNETFPDYTCPVGINKFSIHKSLTIKPRLISRFILLVLLLTVIILTAGMSSSISLCYAEQALSENFQYGQIQDLF